MKKSLSLALILFSFSSFAVEEGSTPVATSTEDLARDPADFNPRKSHWLANFNFEGLRYKSEQQFKGAKKNITPKEETLTGARIGFGGEIYLGGGFMTSTRVEGFYSSKLFKRDLAADPNVAGVILSEDKITSQVLGGDVVQSLSYLFDMKTKNPLFDQWTYLTVEPFVEAGIGMAWAYNRRNYHYDTGGRDPGCGASCIYEYYKQTTRDDLMNMRVGAGVHFTSRTGYFFTMRVTQNRYDVTKRNIKGTQYTNGSGTAQDISVANPSKALDPVMVYSVGGGYKF